MASSSMKMRPTEITTTQSYSRTGMGFLWNKRAELDPGQVKILNAIYNNKKKKDIECKQTITYKLSKSKAGQMGYGRYYSSIGGLETVEREARGTLCREYYHDVDIVNCHPVLLEQFAQKRGSTLKEVKFYNENRDAVLKSISDDRDAAKSEIIRMMYGGGNGSEKTKYFAMEIQWFIDEIIKSGDYKALWDVIDSDPDTIVIAGKSIRVNKRGKFLSLILQTEEATCMLAMKEALEKDGWSVDVLCYDGVMIRIRDIDFEPSLRKAEEAVLAIGYAIKIVKKEMEFFDVPKAAEEVAKGVPLADYTAMKSEFERTHFYHIPTDQIAELNDRGEIFFMKKPHAYNYLTPKWHFKHSEKLGDYTPFLDVWLKDDKRSMIDKIDFAPSNDASTFVMPFHFAHEKATAGEGLDVFMDVMNILASDKQLDYILDYFAHLLQKPLENPKVAIVLTGLKGCGKDTAIDFLMEYVVGSLYSKNYDSNEQFFDKHDIGRLNKFLVKLEEADPLVCKKNASNLKARITSKYSCFNPKGLNPFEAANYIRQIFTTNKGNPFEMGDGERRFFICNANASRKGDFEFWKKVRAILFTPEAGRAVAEMLLARDISNWNSFDMPISEYQAAVIESEKTTEQSFMDHWSGEELDMSELYNEYKSYCVEKSLPHAMNSKSFGIRLLPFLRDGLLEKRRTNAGVVYKKV